MSKPEATTVDLHAERALLGSVLLSPAAMDEVLPIVKPTHLFAIEHQQIFRIAIDMHEHDRPTDTVTMAEELERRGVCKAVEGAGKVLELQETVPHARNAKHYAEIVVDKFRRRTAQQTAEKLLESLRNPGIDTPDALASAEVDLHKLIEDQQSDEPQPIAESLVDALAAISARKGLQQTVGSGFHAIDQQAGGIPLGMVTVLAARPSVGKSALGFSMAPRIAELGVPVLFISYEQPRPEITSRLLSIAGSVPLSRLMRGECDKHETDRAVDAANHLARLPLFTDDACRDESGLCATIRTQVRRRGVKVVIIDYLQLIEPRDKRVVREQQVSGISRSLKLLAMQLGISIILVSQLNRQAELREGKRPRLSDLRESGAIEQDADVVMFVHRPGKDDPQATDDHAEIIVAKNRNGPTGTVRLDWKPAFAKYVDHAGDQYQ